MLGGDGGPVEPPIRAEIFGPQRFAQHGHSLAATHEAAPAGWRSAAFFPRLADNVRQLRAAHHYIVAQAAAGYDVSPAAEWLLDNFHLIETQLERIHLELPRRTVRALPVLLSPPLAGLPRIYGVAWAFVAHTDGAFDEDLLVHYLGAYQEVRDLSLAEMWALPTTLRVLLLENLRRLAEREAAQMAAREVANLCSDEVLRQSTPGEGRTAAPPGTGAGFASTFPDSLESSLDITPPADELADAAMVDALRAWLRPLQQRGVGTVFLARLSQRLLEQPVPAAVRHWLDQALPDPAVVQAQQGADQAADNLSMSNAVNSLRAIGDADWADLVARASVLMRLMLSTPLFEAEQAGTRDQTLHAIEGLARRSGRSELAVARVLLGLMQAAQPARDTAAETPPGTEPSKTPGHWLHGAGRPALTQALGLHEPLAGLWRHIAPQVALPVYLGALALGTLALMAWTEHLAGHEPTSRGAWGWLGLALLAWPASEAVVAVVNRLVSEWARPVRLPRLALVSGIPAEHRTLVVIPTLLSDPAAVQTLLHRLHLHYLANPEAHAQFALLSDFVDADTAQAAGDALLLDKAAVGIDTLNAQHPSAAGDAPRFVLLHRPRRYCRTERRWMGWERKRGKLVELLDALVNPTSSSVFLDLGARSRLAAGTRYLLTLDGDTQLPPGRLRALVGVAAHPSNQPRLSASGLQVASGYGILQPHVVTPLPARAETTAFHWLFAGHSGIDPYSAASSEVYQDLFGEGSFCGKGLLQVQAVHAVLGLERLPDDAVLSHDLLEGSLARCAAVTDISVIEEAPFQADVASARVHRWTRGDWQLLPLMFSPSRWPLRAVNRWKMLDNLRRSLVAPASLALLLLALMGFVLTPLAALSVVLAAYSAGPLMGALAGLAPSRSDVAWRHFYRQAGLALLRALCGGLWGVWQLGAQALLASDAVWRTLWRLLVSRRHLLQWTPFAAVQAGTRGQLGPLLRRHAAEPALALVLPVLLTLQAWLADAGPGGAAGAPAAGALAWAWGLGLLWASAPLGNWWVSRPRQGVADSALTAPQRVALTGVARDTWRFFERCVTAQERHLPPDNLQVLPHDAVAHRTSPTNIGLYLLSASCARAFGWIGTQELLARLEATLGTLGTLQRCRGHFLNWYDTRSGAALSPVYVSTVDSGNLSGHLLAVAQACRALALAPYDTDAQRRAVAESRARLASGHAFAFGTSPSGGLSGVVTPGVGGPWLASLLGAADPLSDGQAEPAQWLHRLACAQAELDSHEAAGLLRSAGLPWPTSVPHAPGQPAPAAQDEAWLLADHLATLRSALLDLSARGARAEPEGQAVDAADSAAARLLAVAHTCETLAWQADFRFLYHRKRHLFHIGWRVDEQQLDGSFYDLLASESRLASLLAIAKGDVPVNHWAALGRPFFAVGTQVGLRSWSGSMFEYLMPSLVLDEPPNSVLREACATAVTLQQAFGALHGMPWGASESAHAGRDHTLAYQYAPHGVPALALRRTPPDERVIAPYASLLAAQMAPQAAQRNLMVLQARHARGRYGFIEALDYSVVPPPGGTPGVPVATYMAHHQGMSIVALANVLLDGVARRWGMADAHIQAVGSLLHERVPREVAPLPHPLEPTPQPLALARAAGGPRHLVPGVAALSPTQLLSNGRYQVALRPNGAGTSRWSGHGLSRWRDDALADDRGHFFFLRRGDQVRPVSLTQHPAPDPSAHYSSQLHVDRMVLDASWSGLHSRITVWVSPEDDIEFRQVELHNLGDSDLSLELISAFEPTLAEPRADEAHPAFSNLFVQARWHAVQQALVFERTPRLGSERVLCLAHFLAESDPPVTALRLQTDRQAWLGRNRAVNRPRAALQPLPSAHAVAAAGDAGVPLDTGLDPMCALAAHLRLAPGGKLRLVFATAVADNPAVVHAVVDTYRQPSHVQRSSLMSATMAAVRARVLRLSAEQWADVQLLTTALEFSLTRVHQVAAGEICDRSLLWRFGLSGERPLLLVTASAPQGLGLLRTLVQALRVWSWGGVACDLVVVNAEASSYLAGLQGELLGLRERLTADLTAEGAAGRASLHVLRAEDLSADEASTLHHLARVRLDADGRPLQHHVQEWRELHEAAFEARLAVAGVALVPAAVAEPPAAASGSPHGPAGSHGDFLGDQAAFRFVVGVQHRPSRPWANVLANRRFGTLLTEAGGGCSWAGNSRLNQLTPWSNDPVRDAPGEWLLLQDVATRETWSLTPSAYAAAGAAYSVTHEQGQTVIRHRHGELEVIAAWCVDAEQAVRQLRVRLINHGPRARSLRLVHAVEWMMGAQRADRATAATRMHVLRGAAARGTLLLCTQRERSGGFGGGTAFLAALDTDSPEARPAAAPGLVSALGERAPGPDWTCDRRELVDARGRPLLPDHLGQRSGSGLDPCAALSLRVRLAAGSGVERVTLLGYAESPQAARDLATRAAAVDATQRLAEVRTRWDTLLGATTVATPDPLFDALVNRWLLYQAVSCRLWAKAGFYQAGGATGFRDQLQDTLALAWAAPSLLREQILLCASRQFAEGDVQHWWHAPTGAGVRTHISDDLLWMPHAVLHYLRASGDTGVLDQAVPFLDGAVVPPGAEDVYDTPRTSVRQATVYEHASLAIDKSLRVGAHGLPLMGGGDWNDGMNRVGHEGRGESVWLGWFACALVAGFAPLARQRGDAARAQRWEAAAAGWQGALLANAWDGHWYLRAFFDNGQPLGASASREARIDLIAQAWAVLSGVAPPQRQREALAAVHSHLADEAAGLLRLLDPPLRTQQPSAGYIQSYPPGVRENGGQYSHGAVWALMAQAAWATGPEGSAAARDTVYRWFTWLSPAHRTAHPTRGAAYGLEPYVMAGDICSAPPHVGRGGWSWYTGAAAWMHRAALEAVFGLRQGSQSLHFEPCLPSTWPRATLTLTRDGRRMHFIFQQGDATTLAAAAVHEGAVLLQAGQAVEWRALPPESRFLVPLPV